MVACLDTASLYCGRLLLASNILLAFSHACAGSPDGVYLKQIKTYCTGTCITGYVFNDTEVKCQDKLKKLSTIQKYTCDLANKTDEYRLIIHTSFPDQKLYKTLHIQNAGKVELKATAIADNLEFTNVRHITAETQSAIEEGFRSLTLTNTVITDVTFSELKILKLCNSTANLVHLPNIQEIDIINGSIVHNLTAVMLEPKSTFSSSTIGEIHRLEVGSGAVLHVFDMTVRAIRSVTVETNSWFSMRSSTVDKMDHIEILTDNATMDHVVIGDIPDDCLQISGKLRVSDSEFKNVRKNGITLQETGLVYFENVSINSHLTSYLLQGVQKDPNSTLSIQVMNLISSSSDVYFWFAVFVFPIIVLLLGAVIVFLVLNRKSTGNFSNKFESGYGPKLLNNCSPSNLYVPPAKTEEISMEAKVEKTQMDKKEDKKEGLSSRPPRFPSNNVSAGTNSEPSFPPPPSKQNSASGGEDLPIYVDADSESLPPPPPPLPENSLSLSKSSLHKPSQDSVSNAKPASPFPKKSPNVGPPLQKPTLPQKPPAPNPLAFSNPLKPTNPSLDKAYPPPPPVDTLPPSGHYAGRSKPKPPPRRGSEITTPPPSGTQNELPVYEDTVIEEPVYASEYELEQC